jgi:hypothetical protein
VSVEDGVSFFMRGRMRGHLNLVDSLGGAEGFDRSFREGMGRVSLFKGIPGPGFGNHVLAARLAGGVASGPGADEGHFEVGGASGGGLPVDLDFLEGQGLFFPVRGYDTATRFGRYAWTASVEYRFPVALVNRGPGLELDQREPFFGCRECLGPGAGDPGIPEPTAIFAGISRGRDYLSPPPALVRSS